MTGVQVASSGGRLTRRLEAVLLTLGLAVFAPTAWTDAFGNAYYDATTDSLVVTLLYRGTNPIHRFTLEWGHCTSPDADGLRHLAAQVLDSQWDDPAIHDYSEIVHLSLADIPCRPVEVTLRTAPRFIDNVFVPAKRPIA